MSGLQTVLFVVAYAIAGIAFWWLAARSRRRALVSQPYLWAVALTLWLSWIVNCGWVGIWCASHGAGMLLCALLGATASQIAIAWYLRRSRPDPPPEPAGSMALLPPGQRWGAAIPMRQPRVEPSVPVAPNPQRMPLAA